MLIRTFDHILRGTYEREAGVVRSLYWCMYSDSTYHLIVHPPVLTAEPIYDSLGQRMTIDDALFWDLNCLSHHHANLVGHPLAGESP